VNGFERNLKHELARATVVSGLTELQGTAFKNSCGRRAAHSANIKWPFGFHRQEKTYFKVCLTNFEMALSDLRRQRYSLSRPCEGALQVVSEHHPEQYD
jgi:hypothetical protein